MARIDKISYYEMTELEKDIVMGRFNPDKNPEDIKKLEHMFFYPGDDNDGIYIFYWVKYGKSPNESKRYIQNTIDDAMKVHKSVGHKSTVYCACKSDKDISFKLMHAYTPDYLCVTNTLWPEVYCYNFSDKPRTITSKQDTDELYKKLSGNVFSGKIPYYETFKMIRELPHVEFKPPKVYEDKDWE